MGMFSPPEGEPDLQPSRDPDAVGRASDHWPLAAARCRLLDDEMIKRLLGLKRLPDVFTISRSPGSTDKIGTDKL